LSILFSIISKIYGLSIEILNDKPGNNTTKPGEQDGCFFISNLVYSSMPVLSGAGKYVFSNSNPRHVFINRKIINKAKIADR